MSRTILIECSPRAVATGTVVTARMCFKAPGPANFLGVQWEPVVETPPSFESSIGFDGRAFAASPSPQIGELVFAMNERTRAWASLVWKNAAITIRSAPWPVGGGNPANGSFTTIWTGQADEIAASKGLCRVRMIDAGQSLRTPLAASRFGTSGDTLLDSADAMKDRAAGSVVPLAFGKVLGIPATIVDRTNSIWLFAGRPATSVQGFYDGGAAFTLGVARASLAALQGNVPAAGAVDYCLDSAGKLLARPWDAPNYPFTADATFGSARAADIASTIVALRSGPAFKAGAVSAFNTLQGADCGLYVDDDRTTAAALDELFGGLGTIWKLLADGTIDLKRLAWATPVQTIAGHRRFAPERLRVTLPTGRRSIGYARNNKVHSDGDIASIILAGDLAYNDGTVIEALKPAESGADVTASSVPSIAVQPSITISYDYTNTALAGMLPATLRAYRQRGNTDVSATTTWSLTGSGFTASISSDGAITITATTASAIMTVVSVRDGVTLTADVAINRVVGLPPTSGGGGLGTSNSDNTLDSATSTTHAVVGGPMTLKAGSAGLITCNANVAFICSAASPAGTFGIFAKWQWRVVGGSWADIAAEVGETDACIISFDNPIYVRDQDGSLNCGQVKSGLTNGTDYEVQLLARTPSGTRARTLVGTISAVGS